MIEVKKLEKRNCERFIIQGGTVSYRMSKLFFLEKNFSDSYPLGNISRGGLFFLSNERLSINKRILIQLFVPHESAPLTIKGRVKWVLINPERSYRYQIGIQFETFGHKRKHNPLKLLEKLVDLEKRYFFSIGRIEEMTEEDK